MNDHLARCAARLGASLVLVAAATALPASAQAVLGPAVNTPGPALAAFDKAYAGVNDYTLTDTVSEQTNDGSKKQDRVYLYKYLKPHDAVANVVAGPGAGGGAAWRGGDKVKGHMGGLLSGIKLITPIDDARAVSLRGDTIDQGTLTFVLDSLLAMPGTLSEATGPAIAGAPTTAVTLDLAKPTPKGETKIVVYLDDATHLPARRQLYAGSTLVVTETYTDLKTNVGLKIDDIDI
jgi:outer membrane lipoprotein-sorting protein